MLVGWGITAENLKKFFFGDAYRVIVAPLWERLGPLGANINSEAHTNNWQTEKKLGASLIFNVSQGAVL